MSIDEWWNRFAKSFLKLTEYIIRCSMLDVRCWTFISFSFDQTGRFLARGGARVKLQMSMGLINNVVAGFIPAKTAGGAVVHQRIG